MIDRMLRLLPLTCLLVLIVSGKALAQDAEAPPNIVVFGDSLVAGYQLPPGKSFPERLQAALDARGIGAKIVGAGVSGDTTASGLARLDWSIPEGTDGVILELGANDALRGLPPSVTRENLAAMIERLQARTIKVLLVGMLAPPNMGEDYAKAFNPIYPKLAEEFGLRLYPFFLQGVAADPSLNLEDGMHPNEDGVEVMVQAILPTVEAFITDLRPAP